MKDDYVYPRGDAPGMELRDWFAGMALQGMLANPSRDVSHNRYAYLSYSYADIMIEERFKEQTND